MFPPAAGCSTARCTACRFDGDQHSQLVDRKARRSAGGGGGAISGTGPSPPAGAVRGRRISRSWAASGVTRCHRRRGRSCVDTGGIPEACRSASSPRERWAVRSAPGSGRTVRVSWWHSTVAAAARLASRPTPGSRTSARSRRSSRPQRSCSRSFPPRLRSRSASAIAEVRAGILRDRRRPERRLAPDRAHDRVAARRGGDRGRRRRDLRAAAEQTGDDADLPVRAPRRRRRGSPVRRSRPSRGGRRRRPRLGGEDVHGVGVQGPGRASHASAPHRARLRCRRARPRRSLRHGIWQTATRPERPSHGLRRRRGGTSPRWRRSRRPSPALA